MADFRQLALDFVLEDDETKSASIARKTACQIQAAASNTNPVARWVEAVQPWMPSSNGDDPAQHAPETPDWTARAKALGFLSRTLDFLDPDVLTPSQVNLLVAFFGAMFDVDHKAGIMASAAALSRIVAMKSFQPQSGRVIIQKLCVLKDDFPRQIAKTRCAIYELLRSLITDAAVASDLQYRDGAASGFMSDLLHLCQNERDPDCLMLWFDTLRFFLKEYSPSQEMLQHVYETFKAYFPITLPRTSHSGVTPDELKLQLRKCFSSNHRLASLTIPYLLGKLDQGDGVTVNVKVDVLRTLRACVEEYARPEQSVAPYAHKIWDSLKYEVRNGEVEDTIWAALEVLKAVTTRLKADELRDYTLTIARDCTTDFSNPIYTAAAGRLLVSVLSANATAFVLVVAPAVTHIKENIRHPKSPAHSRDLLKILRVILETRLLLTDMQMSDQERGGFAATDSVFETLYRDVYQNPIHMGHNADASYDDIKMSTEAVQGVGALICQRAVKSWTTQIGQTHQGVDLLLLHDEACADICDALFSIAARPRSGQSRKTESDELVNEAIEALQRSVGAYPTGFRPLVEQGVAMIREGYSNSSPESVAAMQSLCSVLAFVGCSTLPPSPADGMGHFLCLSCALAKELFSAMSLKVNRDVWCALIAGILAAAHHFSDACRGVNLGDTPKELAQAEAQDSWVSTIRTKYPVLDSIELTTGPAEASRNQSFSMSEFVSVSELRNDFLLASLFLCRQLYRRATWPLDVDKALGLSEDFGDSDVDAEYRPLYLVSDLAGFVIGEMNRSGPSSLQFEVYFLSLFRDDFVSVPSSAPGHVQGSEPHGSWDWLVLGPLSVLSFGILKSLLPSGVKRLYDIGVAQQLLISGTSLPVSGQSKVMSLYATRAILSLLANKYQLEAFDDLMATIVQHLKGALDQTTTGTSLEARRHGLDQALTIFTLTGSLLRRCTGRQTQGLLQLLREAPSDSAAGYRLARGLEVIVAPQTFVTNSIGFVQRPLWMQKVYVDLVKPMVRTAVGASPDVQDPLVKTNFGIAVLVMAKHMKCPIYEEDVKDMVRIAISTARNTGTGPDAMAALQVLKNILVEAPEVVQEHLRSVVNLCTDLFSSQASATPAVGQPEWMPRDYAVSAHDAEVQAGCGELALEIVGRLPRVLESRHLFAHAPLVQQALAAACGHRVRRLRRTARLAREAWAELK